MTDLGITLSHPTGNQNSRQAVQAFYDAGELLEYRTTVGFGADYIGMSRWLLGGQASRREYKFLPDSLIKRNGAREVIRNLVLKTRVPPIQRLAEAPGLFDIDWVGQGFDYHFASRFPKECNLFYGYCGFAFAQTSYCETHGIRSVVEAQHVLWRSTKRAAALEAKRSPGWASTLPTFPNERKKRSEDEEVLRSSLVISPSAQVTASVLEVNPAAEVRLVPYGCPSPRLVDRRTLLTTPRPRVLYVGRIVALKGIADFQRLVNARFQQYDFTIIGAPPNDSFPAARDLLSRVSYLGTVGRDEVLREMDTHDVLVLPSLVEGRSLTVLEAISRGLPIVVTPGTGAEDVAMAGAGVVVPNAEPDALVDAVDRLVGDGDQLHAYSASGAAIARANSWSNYRSHLVEAVR